MSVSRAELIIYLMEMRATKKFPIAKRSTDTMLGLIIEALSPAWDYDIMSGIIGSIVSLGVYLTIWGVK